MRDKINRVFPFLSGAAAARPQGVARQAPPAVMALDNITQAKPFRVPVYADDAALVDSLIDTVVASVDSVTRARLGVDPHGAILDALNRPEQAEDDAEREAIVTDAVVCALTARFPGVRKSNSEAVSHATDHAIVAYAAVVAAGLPIDKDRVARIIGDALTAEQART